MGCSNSTGVTAAEHHDLQHKSAGAGAGPRPAEKVPVQRSSVKTVDSNAGNDFHQKYVLLKKLGKGAFARVYSCQDISSGSKEQLAVKITDLRKQRSSGEFSQEADSRLKRAAEKEAAVLERIGNQEYCCRLIASIFCGPFHYMIMEKCSLTLLQALQRVPELTELSLARFIKEMFLGVASVHALRVVHRDLKPDNFLCSGPDSTVKLCDFGLAEVLAEKSDGITGVYGTAPFMAPEMLGSQKYGRPADVWSLGVIMYTLLVGQFPYIPAESNAKAMKAAILSGVPEPSFSSSSPMAPQPSGQALSLMKALLCRDPTRRPSAERVVENAWFTGPGARSGKPPSLRAILSAATRIGAFDMRNGSGKERMDSLDKELQDLQERHQASRRALESQHPEENDSRHGTDAKAGAHHQIMESVTSTTTGHCTTHMSSSNPADNNSVGSGQPNRLRQVSHS